MGETDSGKAHCVIEEVVFDPCEGGYMVEVELDQTGALPGEAVGDGGEGGGESYVPDMLTSTEKMFSNV